MNVDTYNPYSVEYLRQPRPVGSSRTAVAEPPKTPASQPTVAATYQMADTFTSSIATVPAPTNYAPRTTAPAQQPIPANNIQFGNPNSGTNVSELEARNVGFRLLGKNLVLNAPYINATFTDRTPNNPTDLENLDFDIQVHSAEVKVSDVSLTLLFDYLIKNKKIDAPITDERFIFDPNNKVRLEGKLNKFGMKFPFEVQGTVRALPSGELEINMDNIKLGKVSLIPLMKTLGITLDSILKMHNPSSGFYTTGNAIHFNVEKISDQPIVQGSFRGAKTHLGNLSVMVGDSMMDAVNAQVQKQSPSVNYVDIKTDHMYYDGYFVKDGRLRIDDKTPNNPLILNDKDETFIQIKKGFVGIPTDSFTKILREEVGEGGDFSNVSTILKKDRAEIHGTFYGFIPIKLDFFFNKTADGRLMFSPKNPKAFGFIPLPEGWVAKKVQGLVSNGQPYGDGIALNGVGGIDLGKLKQVQHQNGFIVLETGG